MRRLQVEYLSAVLRYRVIWHIFQNQVRNPELAFAIFRLKSLKPLKFFPPRSAAAQLILRLSTGWSKGYTPSNAARPAFLNEPLGGSGIEEDRGSGIGDRGSEFLLRPLETASSDLVPAPFPYRPIHSTLRHNFTRRFESLPAPVLHPNVHWRAFHKIREKV